MYIVSGLLRSGTSMMMRCLQMGGMEAHWEVHTDELTHSLDGYHPNPNGFFQFPTEEMDATFEQFYDGLLVKLEIAELMRLKRGKVILMQRNEGELRQSSAKFLHSTQADFADLLQKAVIQELGDKGIDYIEVPYQDALADPLTAFKRIGQTWPINPHKASLGVDRSLYRHREVI